MDESDTTYRKLAAETVPLRPAFVSIRVARQYLGDIGRSTFYERYLPRLESVRLGGRHMVTVESLDRLTEALRREQQR
jgi:hypothetical protein